MVLQLLLGRIGTGYIYADWNGQIAYTTPNMNGLSLTLGVNATMELQLAAGTGVSATRFRKLLINLVSKVKVHTHGRVTSLVKFGLVSSHKK